MEKKNRTAEAEVIPSSENHFQDFFNRIVRNYPVLSAEEEHSLFARLEKDGNDVEARDRLTYSNFRLVAKIVSVHLPQGASYEDAFQNGVLGLLEAIKDFDYHLGYRLSTFASDRIQNRVMQSIGTTISQIRWPDDVVRDMNRLRSIRDEYFRENGGEPSPEELSMQSGFSKERVVFLLGLRRTPRSIDESVGPDGDTRLEEILPDDANQDPGERMDQEDRIRRLNELLRDFSERDRGIFCMHEGIGGHEKKMTFEEIGRFYGLSKQYVNDRYRKTLFLIKKKAGDMR